MRCARQSLNGLHPANILLAWLLVASSVAAAPEPEIPIRVEINGTSDCRTPEGFLQQVQHRTSHARRARAGELGWSASVTVKSVGDRRLARLMLMATEGEWIERELVAPNCTDALEALAVVLAVLVDTAVDQAQTSNQRKEPTRADEPETMIALPRVATGVYIPWIDDPDFFEKRGISLSPTRFIARIFGSAELDTQLANRPAFGMGLGFEIERWSPSLLRPSFGLSLGWATGDVGDGVVEAAVQRWSLRAHLCPFELLQSRVVSLRPCGRFEAGFIYARSENADLLGTTADHWRYALVRASPYLRLSMTPASGAEVWLDGGLDLLAVRHNIVVHSDGALRRLHAPPALGAYVALAIAVEY
jgi:hypothetical protein